MSKPMTHRGVLVGCDARTPLGWSVRVRLRETKLWWVSAHGMKFNKMGGRSPGEWPRYRLDVSTVKPLEEINE